METSKMSFGQKGSVWFAILNVLQLVGWTAIMIYDGALAATGILSTGRWIWCLVIGGLIILWIEDYHERKNITPRVPTIDDMTAKDAFAVGCMQCFALIPGTSRSGSTIIGGLVLGLSRKAATEFSFFLAIPTIFGATVWDLWQSRDALAFDSLPAIAVGFVVSFVSAIVVVRWLLRYVSTNDFRVFGWYRIVFGIVILVAGYFGVGIAL